MFGLPFKQKVRRHVKRRKKRTGKMKEFESRNRLVVDPTGREKDVPPKENIVFPDKQIPVIDEEAILAHWMENERLRAEARVGQKEAHVTIKTQYPDLPLYVWLLTDAHTGSCRVDYKRFWDDYQTVRDTPNFAVLTNGDDVDNFSRAFIPDAVKEDPLPPDIQARFFVNAFKKLDEQGKIITMSYGNHNDALQAVGLNWESTWLRDFKAPYFSAGGLVHLNYGGQEYKIALTHKFWGYSKLNPTNAAKRFLDMAHPGADIAFIGHYHQSEFLFFRRDAEFDYRYAIMGGTYKVDDEWAQKEGIGVRGGQGGFVLKLQPGKRDIEVLRSVDDARQHFEILQQLHEMRKGS